jgi:hypothetical protein
MFGGVVGSIEEPCACHRVRDRLRQPEVEQPSAALGDHDVAGLQIPMHDTRAMRAVESVSDLDGVLKYQIDGQGTFPQPIREPLALEVLHDERRAAVFPDVI